jgi:hypothetical protein
MYARCFTCHAGLHDRKQRAVAAVERQQAARIADDNFSLTPHRVGRDSAHSDCAHAQATALPNQRRAATQSAISATRRTVVTAMVLQLCWRDHAHCQRAQLHPGERFAVCTAQPHTRTRCHATGSSGCHRARQPHAPLPEGAKGSTPRRGFRACLSAAGGTTSSPPPSSAASTSAAP